MTNVTVIVCNQDANLDLENAAKGMPNIKKKSFMQDQGSHESRHTKNILVSANVTLIFILKF